MPPVLPLNGEGPGITYREGYNIGRGGGGGEGKLSGVQYQGRRKGGGSGSDEPPPPPFFLGGGANFYTFPIKV